MNNNEKKEEFNEALTYLVETANINNGTLTIDEIKLSLNGIIKDDAMYHLVYDYLAEQKITVKGYVSKVSSSEAYEDASDNDSFDASSHSATASNAIDIKEQGIINMYLHDINHSRFFSETEEYEALQNYLADHMNKGTVNLLTEMNLRLVPPIADQFKNKGVAYSDLLQEGNLGLIEGIMTYRGPADLRTFHEQLRTVIQSAMKDAILEHDTSLRIGTHAADRANELDRASITLSKELDRTPTLEELAKYLSLPADEVEQIMKMSLNALTINENIDE